MEAIGLYISKSRYKNIATISCPSHQRLYELSGLCVTDYMIRIHSFNTFSSHGTLARDLPLVQFRPETAVLFVVITQRDKEAR